MQGSKYGIDTTIFHSYELIAEMKDWYFPGMAFIVQGIFGH